MRALYLLGVALLTVGFCVFLYESVAAGSALCVAAFVLMGATHERAGA